MKTLKKYYAYLFILALVTFAGVNAAIDFHPANQASVYNDKMTVDTPYDRYTLDDEGKPAKKISDIII